MSDRFQEVNCEQDVINLGENNEKFFLEVPMFKLEDLLQRIKLKLLHTSQQDWEKNPNENWVKNRKQWLYEGKNCEVLHLGATSWKKGKLRIKLTVEFAPDEPESILDDIRQQTE